MNAEHFKILLVDKERQLQSNLMELKGQERVPAAVGDSIDAAAVSQGRSASFQEGTVLSQMLEQVQDALHRLADGSYGKCILCGRPIELARLEAEPWAALCMEDQEKQERTGHSGGSTL